MASVWYVGKSDARTITAAQWTAAGIGGGATVTWDKTNGWSIPTTSFTAAQLTILGADGSFNIAGADGPRPSSVVGSGDDPAVTKAQLEGLGLGLVSQWPEKFLRDFSHDIRRTRVDATDLASVNPGLAIGHADVQAVAGANGEFFQMPSTVDAAIPATCPVDFGGATQRIWQPNNCVTLRPMAFMVNNWRFMCDDDMFVLYAPAAGAFQLFIDGVYAGDFDNGFVAGTFTSVKFPSKRHRLIEIRTSASFNAIYWRKHRRVWKPKPVDGPRLLAVGDSLFQPQIFTDGTSTADKAYRGWWQQIGPLLGIRDVMIDGVGSTGFIKESAAGQANNFNQRFALNHAPFNPDIAVIAGGTNDVYNGNTDAEIVAAMKTWFLNARAAWPLAKLVMLGGIKPATTWPSDALTRYQQIAEALLADAEMQKVGLYIINTWSPPWLFGTGRDTATTGDGNSDFYTGNDAVHFNVSGYRYFAGRTAERLRKILRDKGSLINTIV